MNEKSKPLILHDRNRFAAIVEHCEDAIISLSLEGLVTSWNRGATKLFGYADSEMIGQPITRLIESSRHTEEDEILARIAAGEIVTHFETQRMRKDGTVLDISLTVSPIKDEQGAIIGASKIARDVTSRLRAEAARQKLIECSKLVGRPFLDCMVEALADALSVKWVLLCDLHPDNIDRARVLAAWGDGQRQDYFEYDLPGTPCSNVIGDDLCFYPANVAELFPDDDFLVDMGAQSYLGVPLRSADGGSLGILAVLNDGPIDAANQPEETLQLFAGRAAAELQRLMASSANERLGRIVEDSASETYVFDAETLKFMLVNRGARENLGYSMEELRNLTPVDIKPLMTSKAFSEVIEPLRSGKEAVLHFDTLHRRKDGTDYNVAVALQLLADETRPVFFAAIEDTTERDAAERALKDVSQRLDTVLNNTTMAVFLMDDRQQCTYMNAAAEELTGYHFEETQGRPLHDVIHHSYPDGRPFPLHECAIDRALPEENHVQGEDNFVRKDGSFYPVAFTASPIRDDGGRAIGTVIEARDITEEIERREALLNFNETLQRRVDEVLAEREAVEAQLRQSQKMDAIGKLTGGVAHDFNNLLQVIGGNLHLLERDVAGNIRAEQRLQNALSGVTRGAQLASQLLAFGRKQPLAPKAVNLGRLVRGMDDLLRRALGEGVEIETVISGGLWNTFVDEMQVENAILNLAINARDAMDGRGKLTIEAGNAHLDDRYVRQHPEVEAGQYVMVALTDTGAGIPPEVIDQVFEPFFTTKPVGKGTGLGLSMVYGLVKQSGGHIKIYSEMGEGTTIRLYLPRTKQEVTNKVDAYATPARGGNETILVVEDDDDVRSTVVELLSELGYRVLRARDATSGLAIVESGVPIDLLFTDVVMPGPMQSREMAQRAQERHPGMAVLFTSGYTENSIVHGGRLDEKVELLSKPYARDELAHRIRSCLDSACAERFSTPAGGGSSEPHRATLKILLVEDELLIRMVAAEMLADLGHMVFEAGSASEALEILEVEPVELLLTDIGLPGISGTSLISQVQKRWPSIKIVVASGFAGPESDQQSDFGVGVACITKPYTSADLECVLRS